MSGFSMHTAGAVVADVVPVVLGGWVRITLKELRNNKLDIEPLDFAVWPELVIAGDAVVTRELLQVKTLDGNLIPFLLCLYGMSIAVLFMLPYFMRRLTKGSLVQGAAIALSNVVGMTLLGWALTMKGFGHV